MSTTCQQVYVRAINSNPIANAALNPTPAEVLARIEADQQALFASLASVTRDRFQVTVTFVTSNQPSGRTLDLSVVSPPVERVLLVKLRDGVTIANQVDVLDPDAELAPRYTVQGQTLREVGNEWDAANGSTALTITYVFGSTPILPNTDYTQPISVPDAWADLLILPLSLYFYDQRPQDAKNDAELARLQARLDARTKAFIAYLTSFGGVEAQRFILPTPIADGGKK